MKLTYYQYQHLAIRMRIAGLQADVSEANGCACESRAPAQGFSPG